MAKSQRTRHLLLAAPRGFCAGVDRAIETVYRALNEHGAPVYVRREIVHNQHVVAQLRGHGAIFVEELDEVPRGAVVVFAAHGVAPSVHTEARERSLTAIDATCPLVTKVHREVVRYADDGYQVFLIGHQNHEEVVGTRAEAPRQVTVIDSAEDAAHATSVGPTVWLSQTTLSLDDVSTRVAQLRAHIPDLEDPPSSDVCYATTNRQRAVSALAPMCDVVLVVGSANSSNSVRLTEVAIAAGAGASYLINDVSELKLSWLSRATTVGISSGASVPEVLVQELLQLLQAHGWPDPEEIASTRETQVFALPREPNHR